MWTRNRQTHQSIYFGPRQPSCSMPETFECQKSRRILRKTSINFRASVETFSLVSSCFSFPILSLCYPPTPMACYFPPWSHLKPYRHYPFSTLSHRLVFQLHRLRIRSPTFFWPGSLETSRSGTESRGQSGFSCLRLHADSRFALVGTSWGYTIRPLPGTWRFGGQLGVLWSSLIPESSLYFSLSVFCFSCLF